jgi:Holliday junction resolvase RusA-like endonuclease
MNWKDYEDKYGNISKELNNRVSYLIDILKFKPKDLLELKNRLTSHFNATENKIKIVIYIEPKATPRPRIGRRGVFYVKGAADNSRLFKEFMEQYKDEYKVITVPTKLVVDSFISTPKMNKIETVLAELGFVRPVTKPDWDNLGKTYSDMIQNHIILDDSLVVEGVSRKFYSIRPRIEITLIFKNKYDSKFNKKKIQNWGSYRDDFEEKDFY